MTQASDYVPARILDIELGGPLPSVPAVDEKTGRCYQRAICLVRLHAQPLGVVELRLVEGGTSPDECARHIWRTLGAQINEHLREDGLLPVTDLGPEGLPGLGTPRCVEERERLLAHAPFVSVIVPTHDRPERIQLCLHSLLALRYPQYEIIVVDNAPSTMSTADFIQQAYRGVPQVRYIREDRPGASRARNCGMMAARGEILAFTDDDIVVDAYWLVELVKAFGLADNVACVTGLLWPLELETQAQFWIEEFGGFSKGFSRRVFDMQENHPKTPLHPYAAGQFGSGANMAFTAAFLRNVGGFDPALGPGSPAQGGEDLSLFFQAVTRGYTLVYEPASLAYHPHHREFTDLREQIFNYGVGLAAYLAKNVLDNPRLLFNFVTKVPYGLYFTLSARSSKNKKKTAHYPKELTRLELEGMLYGPFAYLLSLWAIYHPHKAPALIKALNALPVKKKSSTLRTSLYRWVKVNSVMLFNTGSLVGTTAVSSIFGFAYWWLAARLFSVEAVGFASATISAMALLGTLGMLGLGTLLIGELPRHPGEEGQLISAALILVGAVGGCLGVVFAIVAPVVLTDFQELWASVQDIMLFAIGVSLTAITLILDQALIGLLRGGLRLWRNILFSVAKLAALFAAGLLLSHVVGLTIYATWAIGNALSLAALAGFVVLKGRRTIASYLPHWRLLRKLKLPALQHHIFNLVLQVPGLILPVLVTAMLTATVNAWFYVSFMFANFVSVIPVALTTVLYAMSSAQPSVLAHKVRQTLGLALVACALAICPLEFGARQVLGLYGHTYAEQASWCLRILVLGAFPLIIKNHYVALCRIHGRLAQAMLPIVLGTLLEVSVPVLGARLGGLSGLSLGLIGALCVEALFMSRRVYKAVHPTGTSTAINQAEQFTSYHDGSHLADAANERGFGQ